jgi:excisionase family DNA binding protein
MRLRHSASAQPQGEKKMNEAILISRKDASLLLGISIRTLDTLVSRREIRVRHVGRRILFERREVERFAGRDHETRPIAYADTN